MRVRYYLRKYKRSPYWYYRITRGGKIHQDWRSTGKRLKRDADGYAQGEANSLQAEAHSITLAAAFDRLAEHKERKRVSDATMEILSLKASHVMSHFGASRDVHTLTLADTEGYLDARRLTGVSDSTIEKELRELRAALRQLHIHGHLHFDPKRIWPEALGHSFPARKRWLGWDEYLRVLGASLPQWRDHLTVYVGTGIRYSELYRLTAEDLQGDHLHVRGTKTERADRIVPPQTDALTVLQRRAAERPTGPLFPLTSPDESAQRRAWLRALSKACGRAGAPHASTNDLRRSFASWAWQRGLKMGNVIMWMGHGSAKMIMEVYAQPSPEQGRREMDKMPSRQSPTSHPEAWLRAGNHETGGKKKPNGDAE